MNYPYGVSGGESAFFADFEYRFSNGELLFMRHAPERFVEMGNANWFDHHGFEGAVAPGQPSFALEIGVDRTRPIFDFLEPVVLEIRLTNVSGQPKIVPSDTLLDTDRMVVVLKKDGKPARRWAPYATQCRKPTAKVLEAGQEISESLFVSAGLNGWDLAEPGLYTVQMAMEIEGVDVLSNELRLRVAPPKSYDEEYVAQDVHTDTAGRVMAFDGSLVLELGIDGWRELIERLPASKAAAHARIALALPLTRNYRTLRIDASPQAASIDGKAAFAVTKAKPDEASKLLGSVLLDNAETAVSTLGRVDYGSYGSIYARWLKENGADKEAKQAHDTVKKAAAAVERRSRAAKSEVASKAAAE